jgi:6-phospho-3-hexuloisomerase
VKHIIRTDLEELGSVLAGVQPVQADAFLSAIQRHERIFVLGKGRSGMVMSMFAMRLMHLGLDVHVVGEATAPAIRPGDLLVVGSGSGETQGCVMAASKARSLGATIALLGAVPGSSIGRISDILVILPCRPKDQAARSGSPLLAGTLFEQALLVFCDSACSKLAANIGKDPSSIMDLHNNIE